MQVFQTCNREQALGPPLLYSQMFAGSWVGVEQLDWNLPSEMEINSLYSSSGGINTIIGFQKMKGVYLATMYSYNVMNICCSFIFATVRERQNSVIMLKKKTNKSLAHLGTV